MRHLKNIHSPNQITFNVEQEESIRITQVTSPSFEQIKGKHSSRNDKKNLTLASQRGNHNKSKQPASMSMVKERNDNVSMTARNSLPNELYIKSRNYGEVHKTATFHG